MPNEDEIPAPETGEDGKPKPIPYDQFKRVWTERQTAKVQLATATRQAEEARGEMATLKTAHATEIATVRGELATKTAAWDAERSTWEEDRAIMGHGISDPADVLVVKTLHKALPAEGRPKVGDWLGALKADPTKAPRLLASLFAAPGTAVKPGTDGKPVPQPGDAGARGGGGGAGAYTTEQIRAAKQAALVGNTAPWLAMREAVLAQIVGGGAK